MRTRLRLAIVASVLGALMVLGAAFADRCPECLASNRNFAANARALGAHYLSRRDAAYRLEGRELYLENCSVCHGDHPAAVDLADAVVGQQSDLELFRRIRGGAPSPAMPAFGDLLSPSQTFRVVAYLRSAPDRDTPLPKPTGPQPLPDGSYKILVVDGGLRIYSLDAGYAEVRQVRIPGLIDPRGCGASAVTGRMYVSYRKDLDSPEIRQQGVGWLSAIDLASWEVLWTREYAPSVDSFALTPDGRALYLPSGERSGAGKWRVIDASDGDVVGEIPFGTAPHNTIMGPTGERVYLAASGSDYLGVADTRTGQLLRRIGPFGERIRPFAINGSETFAFVNVNFLSGFEVADLRSGQVIHRVEVEGYPWTDPPLPLTQSHGVAITPDEGEAWVADAYNRRVHVFDIRELPARPRQTASVSVADARYPSLRPKWINLSRDGRYVHVSTGAVIAAATRQVVRHVAPTKHFLEVEYRAGEPIAAYSRYGNGYVP